MLNILPGIIGLGLLILIHEFGHFAVARLCGIRVLVFSVGLGKAIFERTSKSGTVFRLAIIPFGGYVKMSGEAEFREALEKGSRTFPNVPGSFYSAAAWKRILVALAGPAINILCGLIFLVILGGIGYEVRSTRVVPVDESSPAWVAGIRPGDRIIEIDGLPTTSFTDVSSLVSGSTSESIAVTVERGQERLNLSVLPTVDTDGTRRIGALQLQHTVLAQLGPEAEIDGYQRGDKIVAIAGQEVQFASQVYALSRSIPAPYEVTVERDGQLVVFTALSPLTDETFFVPDRVTIGPRNLGEAFGYAFSRAGSLLSETIKAIGSLFSGAALSEVLLGPLRLSSVIGENTVAAISGPPADGVRIILELFALINLALAFGNLLPLPVLDGGQVLMSLFELVARRPLRPSLVAGYTSVGSILMLGLLAFVVVSDILHLIS